MSDFADGILIGEICEGVFDQIIPELRRYEVPKVERDALSKELGEQMNAIAKSYQSKDKEGLYVGVRTLRGLGTRFQFKCWRTMKPKADLEERLHRLEVS